ncbi:MAG: hypothetical protein IBX68_09215, partial [Dehalococcoidia bacterium]|nr:hypothetical protein [Dehalococcoidia bacterium]
MNEPLSRKILSTVMILTLLVPILSCSGPSALPNETGSAGAVVNGNRSQDQGAVPGSNQTPTPGPAQPPSLSMEQFGRDRDTTGYVWLNYRVFMNSPEGWPLSDYILLLQEVVYPALSDYSPYIGHFHFFRYAGPYSELNEEEVEQPLDFRPDQWAHIIKFRVLVETAQEDAFDSSLTRYCESSASCAGVETVVGRYDIAADLGKRFGDTRAWHVADLVQAASVLALAFAVDGEAHDPDPRGRGGSSGLVHLVSNT